MICTVYRQFLAAIMAERSLRASPQQTPRPKTHRASREGQENGILAPARQRACVSFLLALARTGISREAGCAGDDSRCHAADHRRGRGGLGGVALV